MNARNGSYKTLGMIFVLGMLVSGCGPSGDELFRQAQEAAKNNNEELAAKLMIKAADKGCLDAMVAAGEMYIYGEGVEPNKELGFSMIRKAAEAKHPDAMYVLGECYEKGTATIKDVDKARYWKKLAFEKDCPMAMYNMASTIYHEINMETISKRKPASEEIPVSYSAKDKNLMSQAVKVFQRLVEEERFTNQVDVARIHCLLGNIYAEGLAISQNTQSAISHYEKAIKLGSKTAVFRLGSIYCEGKLCQKDYDKGVSLLQKSLTGEKEVWVLEQLGKAYVDQDWPSADFGKAKDYFERAVYQHDNSDERKLGDVMIVDSLYWLGRILVFENKKYRDEIKGIKCLKRASEAFCADAKYFLAVAYCDGIGVKKDIEKAYDLSASAKHARDKTIASKAKKLHDQIKKQLYPLLDQ